MSTDEKTLSYQDILELIPHRPPFLMVDRVQELVPNERACGFKMVSSNEPYLVGHFPDFPVVPGVVLVEGMGQTAIICITYDRREEAKDRLVYLTTIEKAKFRKPVLPGDVVRFDVSIVSSKDLFFKFEGVASVDGKTVASCVFSAMGVKTK